MALTDALVVLGVFVGFGYIIFAQVNKKNPELIERIKSWIKEKKELPDLNENENMERIYNERRKIF